MHIQIGKYIIKNCDERNLVIIEQRPAGKNPKTGEMGTGVKEVTVGYYPNLEWALHKIKDLNISRYIRPQSCGAIVHGGAMGVDSIADSWAKANNLETIVYEPNYKIYGKSAPLVRDEEMVEFADVTIAFWDGKSKGTKYTFDFAKKIGRKVIIHLIQEYD